MNDKLKPIRTLFTDQTTLVLATADANGLPRSTPLFFIANQDLNLFWFSSRSSIHSRNCALQPAASVSVSTDAHTWQQIRGVQMQGSVSLVADRVLRKSITAEYVQRFELGNIFSLALRRSALYCFKPTSLRYLDNARRFGYKLDIRFPLESPP